MLEAEEHPVETELVRQGVLVVSGLMGEEG